MAGRIPEQFIDDVVARTDLVELIGSRLKLKSPAIITQASALFITKRAHPSASVRTNSSIIALAVALAATHLLF